VRIFDYRTNDKLKSNISDYRNGKRDFSSEELNEIKLYISKYKDVIENTKFYAGAIKEYKVVSCFAETNFYEELHSRMINNYGADIAIIVILTERRILFKKNNKTCKIDLCKLAQILSDGECDETSTDLAAGKLTDSFINLSKKFIACL
jgi:hypothetical protein